MVVEERGFAGEGELKEWFEKARGFVKTMGSK
jgi:hypothetical protein